MTPGLNLINILLARFSYESTFLAPKFCTKVLRSALRFLAPKYWQKKRAKNVVEIDSY